jgi:hypothetical protein
LAYVATHNPKLLQKHDKYYYVLELPIEGWCEICLGKYQTHNKERFVHELLRRGSTLDKDEAKHLRCIPIEKGEYHINPAADNRVYAKITKGTTSFRTQKTDEPENVQRNYKKNHKGDHLRPQTAY